MLNKATDLGVLKITDVGPNDVIVLKSDKVLSIKQLTAIKEAAVNAFPTGTRIALLDGGLSIEVLRQSEQPRIESPTPPCKDTRT